MYASRPCGAPDQAPALGVTWGSDASSWAVPSLPSQSSSSSSPRASRSASIALSASVLLSRNPCTADHSCPAHRHRGGHSPTSAPWVRFLSPEQDGPGPRTFPRVSGASGNRMLARLLSGCIMRCTRRCAHCCSRICWPVSSGRHPHSPTFPSARVLLDVFGCPEVLEQPRMQPRRMDASKQAWSPMSCKIDHRVASETHHRASQLTVPMHCRSVWAQPLDRPTACTCMQASTPGDHDGASVTGN